MKLSNKKKKVIFNTIQEEFKKYCEARGIDFSGDKSDMLFEQEIIFNALTDFTAGLEGRLIHNIESTDPIY